MQNDEKRLIVIYGPPGSGKSTISGIIHEKILAYLATSVKVISVDCIQQYLVSHSSQQLQNMVKKQPNFDRILQQFHLKRSIFNEQRWKASRQFIKNNLKVMMQMSDVVILEDDLLLRSQRKNLRTIAFQNQTLFLQINMKVTLQECLSNIKYRNYKVDDEYQISQEVVRQCFFKMEREEHQNNFEANFIELQQITAKQLLGKCKIIIIITNQQEQSIPATEENHQKDRLEIAIRKTISQIITNQTTACKYFPGMKKKQIANSLAIIKKFYMETAKAKSIEGFLQCLVDNRKELNTKQVSK